MKKLTVVTFSFCVLALTAGGIKAATNNLHSENQSTTTTKAALKRTGRGDNCRSKESNRLIANTIGPANKLTWNVRNEIRSQSKSKQGLCNVGLSARNNDTLTRVVIESVKNGAVKAYKDNKHGFGGLVTNNVNYTLVNGWPNMSTTNPEISWKKILRTNSYISIVDNVSG